MSDEAKSYQVVDESACDGYAIADTRGQRVARFKDATYARAAHADLLQNYHALREAYNHVSEQVAVYQALDASLQRTSVASGAVTELVAAFRDLKLQYAESQRLVEQLQEAAKQLNEALPGLSEDRYLLDWWEQHRNISIGWDGDDESSREFVMYHETGGRNDREWHVVGRGDTLRQALTAARDKLQAIEDARHSQ